MVICYGGPRKTNKTFNKEREVKESDYAPKAMLSALHLILFNITKSRWGQERLSHFTEEEFRGQRWNFL